MELWQYYRILRKRKWLIIIGTIICVSIVAGALSLSPDKWEAYATVMERTPGGHDITIFYSPVMMPLDPQIRLENVAMLAMSQSVLQRSAETLLRLRISSRPEEMLRTLSVRPIANTMLLGVYVQSDSQVQAKATADVVVAEFIAFYNELNYSGPARSRDFIQQEMPKAQEHLYEMQDELRKFREETGTAMMERQIDNLLNQMSQLQVVASQQEIQARQAAAKVQGIEQQLEANFPDDMRTSSRSVHSNPVWQSLEIELSKQQIELQRMLSFRTEEHPDVEALRKSIAQTEERLELAGREIMTSTQGVDPVRDSLVQQLVSGLVEHASASAARSGAQQELDALQPQISHLPAQQMKLAQLRLEEESARATYALLRQKLDEAKIKEQEAETVSSVHVVDPAIVRKVDQRKPMKVLLALILAPLFCGGIAFLLNYLDNTVKTPAEAEDLLQLPVFAVVPLAKSHSLAEGKSLPAVDTSYQMLSTNLAIGDHETDGNTLLVASAEPDVGRSVTAANLAITLARDGARVILVDSDLRRPTQHLILDLQNEKGLSNVLAGQLPLADALQPTNISGLLAITSGPVPSNPVRLLRTSEMEKFVKDVNELADFVVFDSPAGVTFADSTLLAAMVKNVLIVHSAGTVPRGAEVEFRTRLEQSGANLIGAVLNMVRPEDSHGYYHFRSGYEDLMRDDKGRTALSSQVQDLDEVEDTSDNKPDKNNS